jgi:GTP-binding protein EngB required for normal cell division
MIKDEQIIKVIAEATGNRYDPKKGSATNTLGWRQYSNAGKIAAKLNKEFGLSLTSMEILNCSNIAAVLILVKNAVKNKNYSPQQIDRESIIKTISEASGNYYDPDNTEFANTNGWEKPAYARRIAERLNSDYSLSLTANDINRYQRLGDLVKFVQTYGGKSGFTTSKNEMLNIVITGKSGAGKSSFLNYLIGKEHFKVGEGSPVTQAYFEDYVYQAPDTGVKYHLYDTKGIEPTTTKECRNVILNEIEKRDKLSLFEWIHTVYYCFDASSKRIQPFEINFINELKKHASMVILLTKKDLVTTDDLNSLISQIEKEVDTKVQVIPVCSVEQRTRKGISHREGKEDVLRASFLGLWEKLANSYPHTLTEPLTKEIPIKLLSKKDINEGSFSIKYLSNYPLYDELRWENIIVPLMDATNNYIQFLFSQIESLNIDYIWRRNDEIHQDIFNFYQKVNKEKPKVLYSNIAKDAMKSIAKYEIQGKYDKLVNLTAKIRRLYKDVHDTVIFDGDERIAVHNCFSEYRDLVMKIGIELNLLINNYLSSYHAELIQYGQYCIKKEAEKEEHKIIGFEGELSSKEKTYYQVVIACLEDRKIEDSERFMLEKLFEVLEISPTKAGLIEDFARKKTSKSWKNIGRNDPCPCGSGLKYKKCHGKNR